MGNACLLCIVEAAFLSVCGVGIRDAIHPVPIEDFCIGELNRTGRPGFGFLDSMGERPARMFHPPVLTHNTFGCLIALSTFLPSDWSTGNTHTPWCQTAQTP